MLNKSDKVKVTKLIELLAERIAKKKKKKSMLETSAANKSLVGKYLVSEWGYSMSLTAWVKVISETPKTLLVKEVKSRNTTTEEDAKYGLTCGWLQNYVLPTDEVETRNGEEQKAFRVYKRSTKTGTIITPEGSKQQIIDIYVGRTPGSSMKHYFELWDGKPTFENHCD